MSIEIDVIESVNNNPKFIPDCVPFNLKLEHGIITALKMYGHINGLAYNLLHEKMFSDYYCSREYNEMERNHINNKDLVFGIKNLIWKLSRYWLCRKCSDAGLHNYDWRTITVVYPVYLSKQDYNEIREWEKVFHEIQPTIYGEKLKQTISTKVYNDLFYNNYYTSGWII